jgi:hypothetical protein
MPEYRGYSIAVIKTAPLQGFATIQRYGRGMKSPPLQLPRHLGGCRPAGRAPPVALVVAKVDLPHHRNRFKSMVAVTYGLRRFRW